MDLAGAAIHRAGKVSPTLKARLQWSRSRRSGDFAMRVVDAMVQPGQVVVDVGAAWGLYSARFAQLVGRHGVVHAFEPNPTYAPALKSLARSTPQLRVHLRALSDRVGVASLHVPEIGSALIHEMAMLAPPAERGWETGAQWPVALDRLDNVVTRADFIKCDVEGHEVAVLAGAPKLLATHPPVLVEVEQRHHDEPLSEVFAAFRGMGYEPWAVRPTGLVPLEDFDVETDQLAHLRSKSSPREGEPIEYVKDFLLVTGEPPMGLQARSGQ
jgi:FkbM family methyltransferase